eukprot:FR735454.1.p1 GENE.FR735454.1~~FR735454.1.p1  ORF type:complete len:119 (+),score=95.93 FR735454.1:886-1242(+)
MGRFSLSLLLKSLRLGRSGGGKGFHPPPRGEKRFSPKTGEKTPGKKYGEKKGPQKGPENPKKGPPFFWGFFSLRPPPPPPKKKTNQKKTHPLLQIQKKEGREKNPPHKRGKLFKKKKK